jgi:hypothetical protein
LTAFFIGKTKKTAGNIQPLITTLFSQSWDLCTIAIGVVLIEAFKWKTII